MLHLFASIDTHIGLLLIVALMFVLFYEAINGFHDTANAVATVIYTRAMGSQLAVVMAGVFNFLGVMLGGLSVAYAIVHLLPTDLLLNMGSSHGLMMIFSMLLAAIIWNLSTWYLGLPASSSHTLIGAIIGTGLTHAFMSDSSIIDALNIPKMRDIFLSLILSPFIGLIVSGGLIFLLRRYWSDTKKRSRIHMTPAIREKIDGQKKPPFWTRITLIVSAIGVSYSHGANDGQKGVGLIMLVLLSIVPAGFAVNMNASDYDIKRTLDSMNHLEQYYRQHHTTLAHLIQMPPPTALPKSKQVTSGVQAFQCDTALALATIQLAQNTLNKLSTYDSLNVDQRAQLRRMLMCISDTADKVANLPETHPDDKRFLNKLKSDVLNTLEYAPIWIIVAVALALSIGTMIGWRRVATTIGEKIGKKEMTYAEGVSAQLTAAVSIGAASYTGMPVSTTHILSSSVAGAMLAGGGGIQYHTVKNIALAWIFTLPISILLSGGLYWIALQFT